MLNKYAYGQIYNFDMGKWWSSYKQYYENINDIIEALEEYAPAIRLISGKPIIFKAEDKLNRVYKYEFKGFIDGDSLGNIELYNIDLKEKTIIEFNWFKNRVITVQ